MARAKDPRVVQVMASLSGEYDVVMVARSDGVLAADVRPLVRVSITVIAEQNGREIGSSGGGGRFDYAYFSDTVLDPLRQQSSAFCTGESRCETGTCRTYDGCSSAPAGRITA
jgi:TldD protein